MYLSNFFIAEEDPFIREHTRISRLLSNGTPIALLSILCRGRRDLFFRLALNWLPLSERLLNEDENQAQ